MSRHPIDYIAAEAVQLPDGRTWRGPNAESNAARALLADGMAPDTRLVFCRDGRPALEGPILAFAARTWAGAEADPAFRRWRPHPRQNAFSRLAGAGKDGVVRLGVSNASHAAIGASGAGGAA
jgi:hypothetical protein